MNNPLRYGGETFYQSGLQQLRPGVDMTVLQVVTNDGWMIPYVSCMIVAVGMLAHFLMGLIRFLNRNAKTRGGASQAADEEDDEDGDKFKNPLLAKHRPAPAPVMLDPIQQPPQKRWVTPALSAG